MLHVQNLAFCQTGHSGHSAVPLVVKVCKDTNQGLWRRFKKTEANVIILTTTFTCLNLVRLPLVLVCQESGDSGLNAAHHVEKVQGLEPEKN